MTDGPPVVHSLAQQTVRSMMMIYIGDYYLGDDDDDGVGNIDDADDDQRDSLGNK